jgi:hypothetical protein
MNGEYIPVTLLFAVEMLEILGADALRTMFQRVEVLSLRNMCGEGVSLTHKEWKYSAPFLNLFPNRLSEYLLNGTEDATVKPILVDFLECLLANHPVSGHLRICNKLLPLLQHSDKGVHDRIKAKAIELQSKISVKRDQVYESFLKTINITELEASIQKIATTNTRPDINSQMALTDRPPWYNSVDSVVESHITTELLMGSTSVIDFSQLYTMVNQIIRKVKPGPMQSQVIGRLTSTFNSNHILFTFGCINIASMSK